MSKLTVGIVDYGVGNHTSVRQTLHDLGWRCRTSAEPTVLDACDLLVLPGVGAYRPAMQALRRHSLDGYLVEYVRRGRPLLGICLGMQLLAGASHEDGFEVGLGIVPGEVVPMDAPHWHTGWNTIELVRPDPLFADSDGQAFYFNHSYAYQGPAEHELCRTAAGTCLTTAIRRGSVVGVQFHPEKSQLAGRTLLRSVIRGLCGA